MQCRDYGRTRGVNMGAKNDYFSIIELQLKKWDAKLEKLNNKTVEMNSYVRAMYDEQLKAMRVNRDATYARLQKMRTANESAWRHMRTEMDASWDALKSALNMASSRFHN